MIATHLSRRRMLVVTALVAIALATLPATSRGQAPGGCSFTSANATVWASRNESGVAAYYGQATLFTEGCGEFSPGDISVEFQPVAGQPSACEPRTAVNYDEALCTTGLGTALPGTVITVTASGKRVGARGGDVFFSRCSIILPTLENATCGLPVGS